MKVVKSLEKFGSLIKGVIKIIKNEAKGQDGGLHGMLLGTSGSSLFRNVLAGKGEKRASEGFLLPLHSLNNFEIQRYYDIDLMGFIQESTYLE